MFINLNNNLSIKRLDINDNKDIWLINTLDQDEKVAGKNGFLYSIKEKIQKDYQLNRNSLYGNHYAVYLKEEEPIGYLKITEICEADQSVYLDYALIKEKRGHGYMVTTLIGISDLIFEDKENNVEEIILKIDSLNKESQRTADLAGFKKGRRKFGRYTYTLTKSVHTKRVQN